MRARGPIFAGVAVAATAVAGVALWPTVADTARRRIEERLRQETGQDWRVQGIGLTLDPTPQIVLTDLAFGDDRPGSDVVGARIREVRLTDPVSLVLNSGSSGHAVAEGVSLRSPVDGKSGPAGPALKPGTIRVVARGADASLAESGRAVIASAQTLDIVFDNASAKDRAEIRASLDLPASTATVSLDLPVAGAAPGAFAFALDPRGGAKGLGIAATAKAIVASSSLRLDGLSGTIDGAPFGGSLEVAWDRPKPRITLDARLDTLTLTDETDAGRLGPTAKGGLVVPVAPDTVPDVRWFSGFEAAGSVSVARLTLGPARLEAIAVTGTVKDGILDAALSTASGYGGTARGRYVLSPDPGGVARHELGLSLSRMKVLPLLADIAGARGLDGVGTVRVDIQAKGADVEALRSSLSGSADLAVVDGRIDGLDIAGALGLIPSNGGRGGAMATRLDRLTGSFSLTDGQAVTNDLEMKTSLIEAKGIGNIDLIHKTLHVRLKPQVVAPGAGRQQNARNPLDIPVRISGPWSNPAVSADLSGIAANPAGAIESLQNLGNGILGDENMDVGGALGGLLDGFLGRSDRGTPAPRRP